MRRQATFLVSQKGGAEAESILLNVARTDPSPEVRGQAVFWLSQTGSERAVDAIQEILRSSNDPQVQEKAVFALSQHSSPRADPRWEALRPALEGLEIEVVEVDELPEFDRAYAENEGAPQNVREKAIFWLGQRSSPQNAEYLRTLFGRLRNEERGLREPADAHAPRRGPRGAHRRVREGRLAVAEQRRPEERLNHGRAPSRRASRAAAGAAAASPRRSRPRRGR